MYNAHLHLRVDEHRYPQNTKNRIMAASTFQSNPFDFQKLLEDCYQGVIQSDDIPTYASDQIKPSITENTMNLRFTTKDWE